MKCLQTFEQLDKEGPAFVLGDRIALTAGVDPFLFVDLGKKVAAIRILQHNIEHLCRVLHKSFFVANDMLRSRSITDDGTTY